MAIRVRLDRACGTESGNLFSNTTHSAMIAGYVLIGPVVQRVVTCSPTFCYDRQLSLDRACGTESGNLFSNTTHSAMIAGYVLIGPVVQRVVTCSPTQHILL